MATAAGAGPETEPRGRLIAIEGIDGAGTTTQARMLAGWMQQVGLPTHLTCEPSPGPLGRLIREILTQQTRPVDRAALALLFAGDRVDHVRHEIEPKLARGIHVVTDRYVYSSIAYQGLDLELEWVAMINALAPEPDLTVYVRVDPAVARERRAARGSQQEIFETSPQQERICRRYDELFGSGPTGGSWAPDPAGSGWICPDPRGSPERTRLHRRIQRTPRWAVLDGTLSVDALHLQLRSLARSVCESKTCAGA
jgi:dTMP kinase